MRAGVGVRTCTGPANIKRNTSCYWSTCREEPDQLFLQIFKEGDDNDKVVEHKYFHRRVTEEIADEQYADHDAVWEDFCAQFTLGQITSVMVFGAGAGFESRIVGELALPIVYLLWMYGLTQSPDGLSARTFRLAPFRLLGRISFCVYVLHFPLLHYYAWLRAAAAGRSYWGAARRQEPYDVLGAFALVLGVSTLAYYGIEEPVRRRLQRLLAPRGRTAHAAARAADPELLPADSCAQQAHAADEAGVAMHAVVMVEATPVPGDGGAPAQLGAGARSEPGI